MSKTTIVTVDRKRHKSNLLSDIVGKKDYPLTSTDPCTVLVDEGFARRLIHNDTGIYTCEKPLEPISPPSYGVPPKEEDVIGLMKKMDENELKEILKEMGFELRVLRVRKPKAEPKITESPES